MLRQIYGDQSGYFFVDIVVIMGYNKKNRAVFFNKNGKKEISVAIISKKNSKSFLITNVCHKIIRKLQERQILCP